MTRFLGLLSALAITLAIAAPPAAAESTLTGEELAGKGQISGQCSATAESTHQFTASGTATGPYAGTFQETGSYKIGPTPEGGTGSLIDFQATFAIDSPTGTVTGTKAFDPLQPPQAGRCVIDNTGSPGNFGVTYEATIHSGSCTYSDRGRGFVSLILDERVLPGEQPDFFESFTSDLTSPELIACGVPVPTSKEQCKTGGYAQFGFKNQGQCIAFVEGKQKKAK